MSVALPFPLITSRQWQEAGCGMESPNELKAAVGRSFLEESIGNLIGIHPCITDWDERTSLESGHERSNFESPPFTLDTNHLLDEYPSRLSGHTPPGTIGWARLSKSHPSN